MKRFVLASLLALPVLVIGQGQASAQCYNLAGSFRIKICATGCLKTWCEPFCGHNPCCGPGGCGSGGYGGGGHGCGLFGCQGVEACDFQPPGPWYQYWPYAAHFQAPAPTGFPYWPAPMTVPPSFDGHSAPPPGYAPYAPAAQTGAYWPTGVQAVGYYSQVPSYWYGH
jgi:hypothetical protein